MKRALVFLIIFLLATASESLFAQLTSCTGTFSDNTTITLENETISPENAKRIRLKIVYHQNNATISIYEGTDATGTLLYHHDGTTSITDSIIYTGYSASASSVYIEYTNSNGISDDEYQIEWLGIIDVDGSAYNVKCNGQNDGTANISINGGTSPYTISWSSGESTESVSDLSPGTYTVTVTDNNSCKFDTSYTIKEPDVLTVSSEVIKNNCSPSGSNGELKITAQGGSTPYDYHWSQGGTTQTISGLTSGTYNYTVTDVQGCEETGNETVSEPAVALSSSVTSSTNVYCKGDNTGSITISGVDGNSPYSYQWGDGANNSTLATVSNLLAGTYYFTITDNYNCSVSGNHTVTEPANALTINLTEKTNASHYNAKDGAIKIDPSGVQGTAGYNWTGTDITNPSEKNQSNLGAGTYNVTLTDDYCSTNESYNITQPNIIYAGTIQINSGTSTSVCEGITPPNITSSEDADGPNAFTYSWKFSDDNSTWSDTSSVTTATYTFQGTITKSIYAKRVATDNTTSDVAESNTVFIELHKLSVTYEVINNVLCNGESTGKARVLVSEGTRPYTYNFSVSNTDSLIENLSASSYDYTVTDHYSCKKSGTITITEPSALAVNFNDSSNYNSYGVSCNGKSDGWIEVTASGGTSPYSYEWYNSSSSINQATAKANNLPPETYRCVVTDNNSCQQTMSSLKMTAPAELLSGEIEINGSNTDYVCEGENSFTFTEKTAAVGGSGGYTYDWESSTDNANWTLIATTGTTSYTWNHILTEDTYIRRVVKDGATTAASNSIFLDFIAGTNLSVSNLESEYCYNHDTVTIIGSPTNANGVFTGQGILNSNNGIAKFLPSTADTAIANPVKITYTYTDHGCVTNLDKFTTIRPLPNPDFNIPAKIAKQDSSFTITSKSHSGGIFTGEGMTTDGTLYTRNLSVGTTYDITYKVDSSYGCSNTITHQTLIIEGTGKFFVDAALTIELGDKFCFDGDAFTIYAKPFNNDVSGSFESPIVNTVRQQGTLTPSNYSGNANNEYIVKYNYSGADGAFTIEKTIYVYDVTNEAQIFNLDNSYCNNHQTVSINAKPLYNGDMGAFSGAGITDHGDATALFDVNSASLGSNPVSVKYIYTQHESGCKDSVIQNVTINRLPELTFDLSTLYNIEGTNDTLHAIPNGGEYSPAQYFTNDSIFILSAAGLGNKTITYTYTDENQCENSVSKNTVVDRYTGNIISFNNYYCYDSGVDTIYAAGITNPQGVIGQFYGAGITNIGNNAAIFNPKEAYDATNHEITDSAINVKINFKYKGTDNSTLFTIPATTKIRNNGEIFINNINDAHSYCGNAESIELSATPAYGKFSGDGMTENVFNPSDAGSGIAIVTYTYTDNDVGCVIHKDDTIYVLEVPDVSFKISDICVDDTIKFTYMGTTHIDSLSSILWEFGDDSTSHELNPEHKYVEAAGIKIALHLSTHGGCLNDTITGLINLENNPNADFIWRHECDGEDVTFISIAADNAQYYSYLWDFGDNSSSTEYEPVHKYESIGKYQISRTIKSVTPNSSCKTIVVDTIYVRPVYNITQDNSYRESFENGNGYWIPRSINSEMYSWQYGIPKGNIINKAADGVNIYVTSLDTFYYSNERSAVYSPCFDFTDAKKPMISMSIFKQIENTRDGAVLEYSSDAGATWNIIGEVAQGINWYNSYNITAKPGNLSPQGWTDTIPNWVVASNYIDNLKGKTNIQFRIAFAADDAVEYEGFAFDNVFIGERTRRVLIEHFTSTERNNAINSNKVINNIVDGAPLDVIDIQYHSSVYPDDELYKDYPLGTGTREAYYGISSVPYSIFDGNTYFNFSQDNKPDVDIVKVLALNNPDFDMTLNTTNINNGFNIKLKIKANTNINNKQLQLFTAVVEKAVVLNQNSQLVFQNVLRKFLPSPSGKYLDKNWTAEQTQTFNFEYKIDDYIKNPDTLIVVAFIQDEKTKNILQTVTNDKSLIGTAIKPWLKAGQELDYILYPNPATDMVYFAFGTITANNSVIQIINNTGKVVKIVDLPAEISNFNVSISELPQGLYFIRWINNNKQKIKKLIVK